MHGSLTFSSSRSLQSTGLACGPLAIRLESRVAASATAPSPSPCTLYFISSFALQLPLHLHANHWEYYENGGWKECSELISNFLEDQVLEGHDTCSMTIPDTAGDLYQVPIDVKYDWNFKDLTQTLSRRVASASPLSPGSGSDCQWVRYGTRSIRRVVVLAQPERPVPVESRQ